MQTAQLVLEYLAVILSGPVIGGGVVAGALIGFRKGIRGLLDRGFKIKAPSGWEYEAAQQAQTEAERPAPQEPSTAIQAPEGSLLTPEQRQAVIGVINSLQQQAREWEFRYLNRYLVRGTQILLNGFAILANGMRRDEYDSTWSFTTRGERDAMLQALLEHSLITSANDVFRITDKGRDYIKWRGPLRPLPPPLPSTPVAGIGGLLRDTAMAKVQAEEPRDAVVVDTDTDVAPSSR